MKFLTSKDIKPELLPKLATTIWCPLGAQFRILNSCFSKCVFSVRKKCSTFKRVASDDIYTIETRKQTLTKEALMEHGLILPPIPGKKNTSQSKESIKKVTPIPIKAQKKPKIPTLVVNDDNTVTIRGHLIIDATMMEKEYTTKSLSTIAKAWNIPGNYIYRILDTFKIARKGRK